MTWDSSQPGSLPPMLCTVVNVASLEAKANLACDSKTIMHQPSRIRESSVVYGLAGWKNTLGESERSTDAVADHCVSQRLTTQRELTSF